VALLNPAMSIQVLQSIKKAIGNLSPDEIRRHTERPFRLFLYGDREAEYRRMEDFFAPGQLSPAKRSELDDRMYRASEAVSPSSANDLEMYFEQAAYGEKGARNVFAFYSGDPDRTIREVLAGRPDLAIPLAVHFLAFRPEVSRRVIKKVARENALFALATAVPDIVPFVSLPWAIGEFASDTAVLTANQIRMAFILAAANDRDVGYGEQKGEIGSIVLGAFGWRAIARELVGKIPAGAGLIPKAAIAYAGTRVVGLSLERFYRLGQAYTREERRVAYEDALERGKRLTSALLDALKPRRTAET
jgi:hypothetical protein